MSDFADQYRANAAHLAAHGLYDPADEHDACGVGFIAAIDGKPRRAVVEAAIGALKSIWHRGAVDADGKTGDGAGIHLQIPQDFFKAHAARIGHHPGDAPIAVGQVFLPRTDLDAQERCRCIVEAEILNFGYTIYGWRQVPVNIEVIGDKANATRPEIEQIMIANPRGVADAQFETDLYVIRRRIEKRTAEARINDFYICSLSCRSIIYKGMFLAEQVTSFYPDLLDARFASSFAIYHQRYSTNTFPTWRLAQPFRILAHNGEINTLRGNVNWMACHEPRMAAELFGETIEDLKPVIQPGGSDSAALDSVCELLVRAGRKLPMVKTLCIPPAWRPDESLMPQAHRDLYSYCNSVMEPWDGPAALCATDGRWVLAGMDRNGLRPLRYAITREGMMIAGSEAGMVKLDEESVLEKGRLGPGMMIAVDLERGRVLKDQEIKDELAASRPFGAWVRNITRIDGVIREHGSNFESWSRDELRRRQVAVGWSLEEVELILHPMVEEAKEAVGSMGDDTPVAVLSEHYRGLHHFFRQNFSQVTNPPIDSLRERRVMTIRTRLGNLGNILEEDESQCRLLQLESPVLSTAEFGAMRAYMADTVAEIDCTFAIADGEHALRDALRRVQREAEDAVRAGRTHIVLSDSLCSATRAALPMILATGGVHSHLVRQNLRTFTSLNVRSAECLDVHYVAVLIGVGATTVNAYLAEQAIADRHARGLFGTLELAACIERFKKAIDDGLLKIMSKMGISVLSSYRGGYAFEAIGLSRTLVAEFFPGMTSRISGIGLAGIQSKVLALHARGFAEDVVALPVGGFYRYRRGGETHAWEAGLIHLLQSAVSSDNYAAYKKYSESARKLPPVALRDLLEFKPGRQPVPIEEVESITEIRQRFNTPGMSLGALGPEAHKTLSIAMNRIGAKSDSGEGGEDSQFFKPLASGDNANSAIKQIASGRFGVTADYLVNCREIEIKIAQGAKPGEGGQLAGFKVTEMIAKLRHATPGVMLISPPPHHDIYSIEDLAQLIYDLKQINPAAKVCVKLVARSGIGTIAAGVAKAKADIILVSGHVGGTGASPQTSLKYAGIPWEMGLSEVHQVLTLNRLRHRTRLRTDGGIKTGRDVVIAALLGAEEFGVGTASLVAMGCIMVRQCHSNTCPVGVCTQDPKLREKFEGSPEKVVNLFSFIAEEVREILASLGARTLNEIIGRTDLLLQVRRGGSDLDDLDLNPLLAQADPGDYPRYCTLEGRNEVPDTLDAQMIKDAKPVFEGGEKMQLAYNIRNTHRAIGTRLSSALTRRFGMSGLKPGHITVRLRGSAGQSLGAFAVQGLKLELFGDANDYVGKGLSGGTIVVRPPTSSPLATNLNTIIGNTVLYGATAGRLFAAGQAGERFAVRNSGAEIVIEGCGSNGCEYMTGGVAVILGATGDNFAAGMTGGMAFVYDADGKFAQRINPDSVLHHRIETAHWEAVLKRLIADHVAETQSRYAEQLLADWPSTLPRFWQIVPREMIGRLAQPTRAPTAGAAE
jgi:glutamate synthase (NADPH/NADH) large chain